MLLLPLLALAVAWSHGQAQELLKQREVSIAREHTTSISMDCMAEGIPDFQYAEIHWYRQVPTKAPERILYIGARAVSYDHHSYSTKYSSSKKGTNVCTLTINNINSNDEGLICMSSMLLFAVLLATSFWSSVDMQAVPEQTPGQLTQLRGTSASMSCKLQSTNTVHWYKQLPGEQPKRILYESGGKPVFDSTSDKSRMQVWIDSDQPIYHLTINSLTPRDSAIYFCAYWYTTTMLTWQR